MVPADPPSMDSKHAPENPILLLKLISLRSNHTLIMDFLRRAIIRLTTSLSLSLSPNLLDGMTLQHFYYRNLFVE